MSETGSVGARGSKTEPNSQRSSGEVAAVAQASAGYAACRLPTTFRSLAHRNYRLYFFGQLISLFGSWVQTTALMWLTYQLTGESTWVSLVSAAQILPTFLFGAWGGALADRWPKRWLILVTQSAYTAL